MIHENECPICKSAVEVAMCVDTPTGWAICLDCGVQFEVEKESDDEEQLHRT